MRKDLEITDKYKVRAENFEAGLIRRMLLGKPIDLIDLKVLLNLRKKSQETCRHRGNRWYRKNAQYCGKCGKSIRSQSKKARRAG